ncbi:MAG: ATP synthase F1 subunit gamma [Eubacterium sp. 36_13]|nr:MAG: ATP synthase F1 subunit gamma [Eubacterium sp. 36_13]
MANTKEIQSRMKSIQDTMKITNAMYMISSSKLKKSKKSLEDTEPYFYTLQSTMSRILRHIPDIKSIYFDQRENKSQSERHTGYIVVTADKGMAGAYNHNVIKEAQRLCDESDEYKLYVVGELGRQYFAGQGYPVDADFRYTATNPSVHRARVISELIVELYKEEVFDEVYVIYTKMVSSISEEVEVQQLLPLKPHQFIKQEMLDSAMKKRGNSYNSNENPDGKSSEDDSDDYKKGTYENDGDFFIYPSPKKVLKKLVYNYVTGFMYGALVEASASEENARMMAMQSATNNAEEMLKELSVEYNRVRQAAITQEITEVIGGAKALKKKKKKQVR